MEIKFKKLNDDAVIPSYAHTTDAGMDITATRYTQEADESGKLILVYHTDLAVEIPAGYFGLLCMRSSGSKKSISMPACIGIIDSDYRGEILIKFKLMTDAIPSVYKPFEKVAQLIILPKPEFTIVEANELSETARGNGGFGSTDTTGNNSTESEAVAA